MLFSHSFRCLHLPSACLVRTVVSCFLEYFWTAPIEEIFAFNQRLIYINCFQDLSFSSGLGVSMIIFSQNRICLADVLPCFFFLLLIFYCCHYHCIRLTIFGHLLMEISKNEICMFHQTTVAINERYSTNSRQILSPLFSLRLIIYGFRKQAVTGFIDVMVFSDKMRASSHIYLPCSGVSEPI